MLLPVYQLHTVFHLLVGILVHRIREDIQTFSLCQDHRIAPLSVFMELWLVLLFRFSQRFHHRLLLYVSCFVGYH